MAENAPHAGRTDRHDVGIEHHERQPPVTFQWVLQVEPDDGLFLPVLQPEIAGNPASRFLFEGGRAVLEELLLPAVEDRGLQVEFIAELRDRHLLQQMPPQDGDLLFRCVVLPLLLHAFARLS